MEELNNEIISAMEKRNVRGGTQFNYYNISVIIKK